MRNVMPGLRCRHIKGRVTVCLSAQSAAHSVIPLANTYSQRQLPLSYPRSTEARRVLEEEQKRDCVCKELNSLAGVG